MENRNSYRSAVQSMGKKEFTLEKMKEYGFWPADVPEPQEIQKNETPEDYEKRKKLLAQYDKIAKQIADVCDENREIQRKISALKSEYEDTLNEEKVRAAISQKIMQESIARRKERKRLREIEKQRISDAWKRKKAESIVFIGRGYSSLLNKTVLDINKLESLGLPIVQDDKQLADLLEIEYKQLRFLAYHRDVVTIDHYHRYSVPKRRGGERQIAAPKSVLKHAQRQILGKILNEIESSDAAHGFLKGKSVVTGARMHEMKPALLINMDLQDFFPTITFERVRGMFQSFGYSGYIASILAMLCTYCETAPIEIKGKTRYVKTSDRILPQGSPASPMISNIICRRLDQQMAELANEYDFSYSRYADDISMSFLKMPDPKKIQQLSYRTRCIVHKEGFSINREKTHYLRQNNRQCVTGVVINGDELGVPKTWVKKLRAAIFNANKELDSGKTPENLGEIRGMISWLASVNKSRYQKIISDAKDLLDKCRK